MYGWYLLCCWLFIVYQRHSLLQATRVFASLKKKILFILIVHLVASCTKVDSKCTLVSRHKSIYGLFHRFYILFVVFVITFFLLILYMAIFIMNRLQKGRCHPIAYINVIPLSFFFFFDTCGLCMFYILLTVSSILFIFTVGIWEEWWYDS